MALHVTIQHRHSQLLLEKCAQCCTLYHCPFCKSEVFKPTVRSKLLKHLEAHKKRAVQHKDYTIYKCNLDCTQRPHFHCVSCLLTIEKRKKIIEHIQKCEGTLKAEVHPASEDETEALPVFKNEAEVHPISKDEAGGHLVPAGNVRNAHTVPQRARRKAKKRKTNVRKTGGPPAMQHNANRPLAEDIPWGTCSVPVAGYCNSDIDESEPEVHSYCENLSSDTHLDEGSTDDIKALYQRFLLKEMENRDQEMAYRALKMRKLEKEMLLLDKQLEKR